MSGSTTLRMLRAYISMAQPTLFLSGMFQSPPENFHSSEEVEIDIVRSDEDIAIVVQDLTTGYRANSEDLYTNKGFKPPIFKEKIALNSTDLLKREAGNDPFKDPKFRATLIQRMFRGMMKIERKIRRALELQASQVLQTGILTLRDSNGVALYTLDFKPKSSHFPTAGTAWDQAGATIVPDLVALAEQIRDDGLEDPDQAIFGTKAFEVALKDDDFKARFDNRRIDLGTISPFKMNGKGGQFRGTLDMGNYKIDIWTYGGRYKDPQTGLKVQFVDPVKVILRASGGRLDATFGAIPNIGAILNGGRGRLLPELPGRVSNAQGGMDLFTNAWLSADGEQLFGGIGARPLMIPTAIDTYGCIATGIT